MILRLVNYTLKWLPEGKLTWQTNKVVYKQIELSSPRVAAQTKNNSPVEKNINTIPGKEYFGLL